MSRAQLSKWIWFIGLWLASVLLLGIVAMVIRQILL